MNDVFEIKLVNVEYLLTSFDKFQHRNKKITEIFDSQTLVSPTPPGYYDELLHAINTQIITQIEEGDTHGAVQDMICWLDVVSKWIGDTGLERTGSPGRVATYHLGWFYSILAHL